MIRTKGAYAIGGLALPVLLSTCIVRAGRQNHRLQPTVARIPRMEGLSRRVRQHDQLFDQTHGVNKVFQPQGHANDADPNYSPSQSTMKHGGNSWSDREKLPPI